MRNANKVVSTRDPARIQIFMKRFQRVWDKHPDLRFGQIIQVLLMEDTKYMTVLNALHYLEEQDWMELMDKVDPHA